MEQLIQVEKVHLCYDFILKPASRQLRSVSCAGIPDRFTHIRIRFRTWAVLEVLAPNITCLLTTTVFAHNEQTNEWWRAKQAGKLPNETGTAWLGSRLSFVSCTLCTLRHCLFQKPGVRSLRQQRRQRHTRAINNSSKFIKIHQNSSK